MPAMTKNLKKYTTKFKKEHETRFAGISDFFIMYHVDELIPNETLSMQGVRHPGIQDWKNALYNSKIESSHDNEYRLPR